MKFTKVFAALCLVLMVCTASTMKSTKEGVYMVGVSASFTDSLVYFTDVQFVENAKLENKMLMYRNQYSDQMETYLVGDLGLQNRTCFIYFGNKKKLEKFIKKMKAKYQKEGKSILRDLGPDFKFKEAEVY